jgi:hypothetical protein
LQVAPNGSCWRGAADRAEWLFPWEQCAENLYASLSLFSRCGPPHDMSSDFFSLIDLGSLAVGILAIAVLIFCVSLCVDETPGLSGFLKRAERTTKDKLED